MMNHPLTPYSITYSPGLPALLRELNCSIAISVFQKGKLIFLATKNGKELLQLPRNFPRPMGLALQGDKLAIACLDEVILLANSPQLAASYPKKIRYDALFMPRITYHTGNLDLHDLAFGADGQLYGVNTFYSCIVKLDGNHSFTPFWQPPFITKLAKEDRCHLNGMALADGLPKYATAMSDSDTPQGWREQLPNNGILMDVQTNEILARNLAMPHSPRLYQGALYFLCSATGALVKMNLADNSQTTIAQLEGFARGLDFIGDYAFIGLSRLRATSGSAAKLKLINPDSKVGVAVVHLPTGTIVGEVNYLNTLDEIFDVKILTDCHFPGILNTEKPAHKAGITWPGDGVWQTEIVNPKPENG